MFENNTPICSVAQSLTPAQKAGIAELYAEYVANLASWADYPVIDEAPSLTWDIKGIECVPLRKIQRLEYCGKPSSFLVCYPGLIDSLPSRPLLPRGQATAIANTAISELIKEFCLVNAFRGRGLNDRQKLVTKEFTRYFADPAHLLRNGIEPFRLPKVCAAMLGVRNRVAIDILGVLAGARQKGKIGLYYRNEDLAEYLGIEPRTVRKIIASYLETGAIAWRHVTFREGIGKRPVDQSWNLLVPGPRWLSAVDRYFTGDDDQRKQWWDDAIAKKKRRYAVEKRRKSYLKRVARAKASGRPIPAPPGCSPISFEAFCSEQLDSVEFLDSVHRKVKEIEIRRDLQLRDSAKAIPRGESPMEDKYRLPREAQLADLQEQHDSATAMVTDSALAKETPVMPAPDSVSDWSDFERECDKSLVGQHSSNWEDRLPSHSLRELNLKIKKEPAPTPTGRPVPAKAMIERLHAQHLNRRSVNQTTVDDVSPSGGHVIPFRPRPISHRAPSGDGFCRATSPPVEKSRNRPPPNSNTNSLIQILRSSDTLFAKTLLDHMSNLEDK